MPDNSVDLIFADPPYNLMADYTDRVKVKETPSMTSGINMTLCKSTTSFVGNI